MRTQKQDQLETRTVAEARRWMLENGMTVVQWAKKHGFNRHTVVDLLHGRLKGRYGEAHRAAVALRLKADPQKKAS